MRPAHSARIAFSLEVSVYCDDGGYANPWRRTRAPGASRSRVPGHSHRPAGQRAASNCAQSFPTVDRPRPRDSYRVTYGNRLPNTWAKSPDSRTLSANYLSVLRRTLPRALQPCSLAYRHNYDFRDTVATSGTLPAIRASLLKVRHYRSEACIPDCRRCIPTFLRCAQSSRQEGSSLATA